MGERRRLYRYAVDIVAALGGSLLPRRRHGALADISPLGCRIVVAGRFNPRDVILVSVASFSPFGARVVWTGDGVLGVEFVQPLNVAVVEHLRQLGSDGDGRTHCAIERRWRAADA